MKPRRKLALFAIPAAVAVVGASLYASGAVGGPASAGFASSDCAATWTMKSTTPSTGQWIRGGVKAIKDANTPAQAKQAAQVWRQGFRQHPSELARAAFDFTGVMPNADDLVYSDGCATPQAASLDAHLQSLFNEAKVTPSTVPSYWYNSYTKSGAVLSETGVSGTDASRKALRIEVPSGIVTTAAVSGSGVSKTTKTVYAMARCGNGATQAPAPVSPPAKHPKKAPTPTPSASSPSSTPTTATPTPSTSTSAPTPTPSRTHCDCTGSPSPTPSDTQCGCGGSPSPSPSCSPGHTWNGKTCAKDGTTAPSPEPSNSAPGQNPSPDPSGDPGSNACYDPQTGNPCT